MNGFTIGKLAEKVNLNPSAIRYYEQIGLLPLPERINGHRRYTEEIVPQIEFIKLTQNVGFTIEEISVLLEGFKVDSPQASQWRSMAERKIEEMDNLIHKFEIMKAILQKGIGCECMSWNECITTLSLVRREQ